jgi:ABC-2 type transport system ATP-binding protein
MTQPVIEVRDFRKKYGDFTAVDGIDLTVQEGEIFGLLGPNGAGKTSTLETLEGLRQPDAGSLRVMGINPVSQSRQLWDVIGVQLQSSGLPASIRVDEAMNFFCAYHGVAPRYDLFERLGIGDKMDTQFHLLSTGQQRRLELALAIAHDPPVLFLDEPTAGLDVASRTELHTMMRELQDGGTTIILSTHDMAEAEQMTDRVSILLNGKIAASGSPLELTATGDGLTKVSVHTQQDVLAKNETSFPGVSQRIQRDEYTIFFSSDPGKTVAALIAHVEALDDTLIDLRVERPSLEERFLEITTNGGAL